MNILTKSKYLLGLECPKYLWVAFNEKEKIRKTTIAEEFILKQGEEVGELAKKLFPKLDGDRVLFGEFTKDKVPLTKTPVNCTIFKVEDSFIVDVLSEEEKVASARLSVSVGEKDEIYAMQKGGDEGLLIEEADEMIGAAQEVSKVYRESLKKIK